MKRLTDEEEKRALELHQRAIVIDALNASIMDEDYFQKMQQGGVTAINYTVAMNQNLSETVKRIAQLYRQIEFYLLDTGWFFLYNLYVTKITE